MESMKKSTNLQGTFIFLSFFDRWGLGLVLLKSLALEHAIKESLLTLVDLSDLGDDSKSKITMVSCNIKMDYI